jgi:hypothetical protein
LPGKPTTLDLKVRNSSTGAEELKIEPRGFEFDSDSGRITIDDTSTAAVAQWVRFSAPTFTVKPGEWYTQKITIDVPKEAGFSYSFALIISRKSNPQPVSGGRVIKGSVAVFTLINIDRPGSTRKLEVPEFKTTHGVYEYVPTTLKVTFKNIGNSIVQPYGNIFIQRGSDDAEPISTLKVNDNKAYILPGSTRTIQTDWSAGFPVYKPTASADKQKLTWDWNHAGDFRIGRYTAKLVAVYDDGQRTVPIQQEVTFWVVPWRAILVVLGILVGLILLSRWRNKRRTEKAVRRALEAQKANQQENTAPGDKL